MRSHTQLAILGSFLAALPVYAVPNAPRDLTGRAACNKDNCLRAVIASNVSPKYDPTRASSDCSAFFKATVTPCPVTVTAASTVTVTVTTANAKVKRDHAAGKALLAPRDAVCTPVTSKVTTVPAYPSSFCGSTTAPAATLLSRYSSACSCISVTSAPASTLAAQTVTYTSTVTTSVPQGPPAYILSYFVFTLGIGSDGVPRMLQNYAGTPFYIQNGNLVPVASPNNVLYATPDADGAYDHGTSDATFLAYQVFSGPTIPAGSYPITCTQAGNSLSCTSNGRGSGDNGDIKVCSTDGKRGNVYLERLFGYGSCNTGNVFQSFVLTPAS